MKGNQKLIDALNGQLSDELSAINQYIVHAEMCDNWGYGKLHDHFEKRAIDEMKHAGMLISRILFLEGKPIVSELNKIHIGSDVAQMFKNDHEHEKNTIAAYNEAIKLAGEVKDFATREILEHILSDEDGHIDAIEENQDQIGQMTRGIYLSTHVDSWCRGRYKRCNWAWLMQFLRDWKGGGSNKWQNWEKYLLVNYVEMKSL